MIIRPSNLPKLAVCGQYQAAAGTSQAAARGTMLDKAFRDAWRTGELAELVDDDAAAVRWAVIKCIALNGGADGLTTDEDECRVKVPGIEHRGTADGVAVKGRWLIDLKSGQMHDYTAQMAAYAYGLMTEHNVAEWTTHLLFCDQQKVVTNAWTYQTAKAVVDYVLGNVGTTPVENDYCGWCAKSLTCPARVSSATGALVPVEKGITPENDAFITLLNNPERLGQFLRQCNALDDFRDAAKAKARTLLENGVDVPGWRLQKPRIAETVDGEFIATAVESGILGAGNVARACGTLSAKKARQLWSDAGAKFPEETVKRTESQAPLVSSR